MPEEWLDLAYINFDKAVLFGRVTDGFDEFSCRREREIEITLSDEQKRAVGDLNEAHRSAMQKLLRSFVPEDTTNGE